MPWYANAVLGVVMLAGSDLGNQLSVRIVESVRNVRIVQIVGNVGSVRNVRIVQIVAAEGGDAFRHGFPQ